MNDEPRASGSGTGPGPPEIPGYELLRLIGKGTYGEVWLGRDVRHKSWCAVKMVRREWFEKDEPYEREFSGLRKFMPHSHELEGCVRILDVDRDNRLGYFYCVMELADDASDDSAGSGEHGESDGEIRQRPKPRVHAPRSIDPDSYIPRTLAQELSRRGRLPVLECIDIGISLTTALNNLHGHGLVHRDVKPSNIVFVNNEPVLADVGLVTDAGGKCSTIGTPGYMAPEGPGSCQADIYGLGKVLYEITTGKDCCDHPAPATEMDGVPDRERLHQLEDVFDKACEIDPGKRHVSATAMRDELALVLAGKSIKPMRGLAWAWKNALWIVAGLMILAGVVALFVNQKIEAATERQEWQRRQNAIQLIFVDRLTSHNADWSLKAWQHVTKAAEIRPDAELRNQAAATLAGLDAHLAKRFEVSATSLAFDREGRRLLAAVQPQGVRIWDGSSAGLVAVSETGDGPVAFRGDGTGVQLVEQSDHSFALRDLEKAVTIREFKIERESTLPISSKRPSLKTMTPDGSHVAAAVFLEDGTVTIAVWETGSGKLLHSFDRRANCFALASDGALMAIGDKDGGVTLFSILDGTEVAFLKDHTNPIESLALRRDPHVRAAQTRDRGWLVAAGDSGGAVTIWDLFTKVPRVRLLGSEYDVYAVVFSPDGATLASAGRARARLWDVATGRLLLNFDAGDFVGDLAFSPDGSKLAACGATQFSAGYISVWNLEFGRGIQTLRGLSAHVSKVCFSANGRWIAAISHNWQIGVWDRVSGHLRRVLDAPKGLVADNAALAFNADASMFACVSGEGAKIWDMASGLERSSVKLRRGLVDTLAFHESGKLLAFRMESEHDTLGDDYWLTPGEPRVCRIRDLLGSDPTKPLAEITVFDSGVYGAISTPNGSAFVVEGIGTRNGLKERAIKAFDAQTGRELWSIPLKKSVHFGPVLVDPGGTIGCAMLSDERSQLIDLATGTPLPKPSWLSIPAAIAHRGDLRIEAKTSGVNPRGWSLLQRSVEAPLVTLGIDALNHSSFVLFNREGNLLAWGNDDGSVSVCDLEQIRSRLDQVGLGW